MNPDPHHRLRHRLHSLDLAVGNDVMKHHKFGVMVKDLDLDWHEPEVGLPAGVVEAG